jgi:hypothetical protein
MSSCLVRHQGIVFLAEESEVAEIGELITVLEKERGVEPGITELVLMLESAKGFWNVTSLAQASPRVTALGVGRIDLSMQLGPVPQDEFRLHRFLMTRTLVAARMLGNSRRGMETGFAWWSAPRTPLPKRPERLGSWALADAYAPPRNKWRRSTLVFH